MNKIFTFIFICFMLVGGVNAQQIHYNQYTTNAYNFTNEVGQPHIVYNAYTTNAASGVNSGPTHLYYNYYTTNRMPIQAFEYLPFSSLANGTVLTIGNVTNGIVTTNLIYGAGFTANATNAFTILTNGPAFLNPILNGGTLYAGTDAKVISMTNTAEYQDIVFYAPANTLTYHQVNGFINIPALTNAAATYDLVVLSIIEQPAPYNVENVVLQLTINSPLLQINFENTSTNGTIKVAHYTYTPNHWYFFSIYQNLNNDTEGFNVYDPSANWQIVDSYEQPIFQTDAYVYYWEFGNNEVGVCPGYNTLFCGLNVTHTPYTFPTYTLVTGQTLGTLRNNYTGAVGLQGIASGTGITITSLGRWIVSGNSGTHLLSLLDASGDTLASATLNTVGQPAGQYAYVSIPPTVIADDAYFYIVSQETSGGDYWYDYDTTLTPYAPYWIGGAAIGSTLVESGYYSYVPVNCQFIIP